MNELIEKWREDRKNKAWLYLTGENTVHVEIDIAVKETPPNRFLEYTINGETRRFQREGAGNEGPFIYLEIGWHPPVPPEPDCQI